MDTDTQTYLTLLFAEALDRGHGHLVIWSPQDKRAGFFESVGDALNGVNVRTEKQYDVYCGMGLVDEPKTNGKRGKATDVTCLTSFWADIDIRGTAHKKRGLPPDEQSALQLLDELQYGPSMVVRSGHGLQAYWAFSEPWTDPDPDAPRNWVTLLQSHAAAHGWTLDSVGDLARVFRVPGTVNYKQQAEPVDVTILAADGPVYHVGDLIEACAGLQTARAVAPSIVTGSRIVLSPSADPPSGKVEALRANDRRFRELWTRARQLPSQSEYDMALTNAVVVAGWSDQEIVNLLIAHRRMGGGDPKLRMDYYGRTIGKARAMHDEAQSEVNAFDRIEELTDNENIPGSAGQGSAAAPCGAKLDGHPAPPASVVNSTPASDNITPNHTPHNPPESRRVAPTSPESLQGGNGTPSTNGRVRNELLAIVSNLLGFRIIRWIQRGREPRRAEYSLVLPGGREVLIGKPSDVLKASTFRSAVLAAVGVVMPAFKADKWHKLCVALMKIVEVIENEELYRDHEVVQWLQRYVKDQPFYDDSNWQEALPQTHPFVRDGLVFVHVQSMSQFLQTVLKEKITRYDLYGPLHMIGFEQRTVAARDAEGINHPRSYFAGPIEATSISVRQTVGGDTVSTTTETGNNQTPNSTQPEIPV